MEIRKSEEADIPQIISLLKVSLGEALTPKSISLWKWKHLDNPFGQSPVLVAVDDNQIIGVRAFLTWEFVVNGNLVKACRAVDTAIHPDYQGKGIFSKLTLSLIDKIKLEGIDFIFNSPNTESTPGYIKMGWEKWGKLPLKLEFHLNTSKNNHPLQPESWDKIENFVRNIEQSNAIQNQIQTNLKKGFLKWRYFEFPLFPYYFLSDGENYLLFYRIKESKLGRELRITDLFILNNLEKEIRSQLQNSLSKVQKLCGARFTSFSGTIYSDQNAINLGSLPIMKVGPLVTLRKIKEGFDPMKIEWKWSLGDLEVF
ncbi:GNAT family N-acetyltransferase [Algoriphagus sp.]|uniref:GNAT family N-acetyltransferase n=1 Tax=Algoriphagus sp. TaxID=1872435 RepID=UPI0025F59E8C|nr:GNAT family N-acetyltransferase [Algoriphagus sp.]